MNRLLLLLATPTLALASLVAVAANPAQKGDQSANRPKWESIEKVVNEALRGRADYKPGDLLSKSDVNGVLIRIGALGWQPIDAQKIVGLATGDEEFMVKQLRAKTGQDFMRHVAKYPDGYDRLDRMIRLPRGETFTADLIRNPGGYRMIEYMTTSSGGTEMGKMLSNTRDGKNFNEPTGRIYTAQQLIVRLKQSYADEKSTTQSGK